MQKRKIYFFLGTSAEFIKIAPIIKELQKRQLKYKIITSGQIRINFEDFVNFVGPIKPDITFKEKINKSSILYFLLWAIRTLFVSIITLHKEFKGLNKNNSYFIIHGDTVSSTIGAIIAKIYNLKLVHVESGDLSFNLWEPFPEEICRRINMYLADILLPQNEWAKGNLQGSDGIKINTRQNTLIESFIWAIKMKWIRNELKNFRKYYILIMHRQEHVIFKKNWSRKILEFVIKNADKNLNCILLNHPLTVDIIKSLKIEPNIRNKIIITPRLPYPDFMKLLKNSQFIATDGCMNQLESYFLGKPCLALRDLTEQIEGIGKNVALCRGNEKIMKEFLLNYKKYKTKPIILNVSPSKIIVDYLISH